MSTATATLMRAVRIDADRRLRQVRLPRPAPRPGEVLLRSTAAGICGSDLDLLEGTRPEDFVRYPVVPGHEIAATVVSAPPGADLETGQAVAVAGMRFCGECTRCREDAQNLCTAGYAELGFTEPGAFAEYLTAPAAQVHPLPPGLAPHAAVLLEPAAVVALALRDVPVSRAVSAAVVGEGTLGQLAAQTLRGMGAAHVTVYGPDPHRLSLALRLGADCVRTAVDGDFGEHDVVVETAGRPAALARALRLARRGGHVVLTGVAGAWPHLPADLLVLRHLTVRGSVGSTPSSWRTALELAAGGALRLEPLVARRFPLDQADRAFTAAARPDPADDGVKTVVVHESADAYAEAHADAEAHAEEDR